MVRYATLTHPTCDTAKVSVQFINWHTLIVTTLGKAAKLSVDLTAIDNSFLTEISRVDTDNLLTGTKLNIFCIL